MVIRFPYVPESKWVALGNNGANTWEEMGQRAVFNIDAPLLA